MMESFDYNRYFTDELDPETFQRKFLLSIVNLQNVERGSIWIKKDTFYQCVEAIGNGGEEIKGVTINTDQKSIVGWVIENGKMTISDPMQDVRHYKELEEQLAVKSRLILCFPLFFKDKVYGAVQIIDTSREKSRINLEGPYLKNIQDLINIGSVALSNAIFYNQKQKEAPPPSLPSIEPTENIIIGQSPAFKQSMKLAADYAQTDYPVLITGESGTGKEVIANRIHKMSLRSEKPFYIQNCSAIPETLLESELFGYKKGAFSGAIKDKVGLFEAADGGTVFLDEIGDMALNLQARILRIIQNKEIKPLGDTRVRHIDVRVISATNKNLEDMVIAKAFREDLFYRLSVLPIHLPPLRDRLEDIPLLLNHFIKLEAAKSGVMTKRIRSDAMQCLIGYHWPGNIRELQNLVRYLLVVTNEEFVERSDLPVHLSERRRLLSTDFPGTRKEDLISSDSAVPAMPEIDFGDRSWDEVESEYVFYLLRKHNWNVTWASRDAKVNRSTFASRMKRLGIKR